MCDFFQGCIACDSHLTTGSIVSSLFRSVWLSPQMVCYYFLHPVDCGQGIRVGIYVPWLPHLSLIDGLVELVVQLLKPQMEFSYMCSGSLHLECNVLPLCNNVAAIAEIAVAKVILLVDLRTLK